MVFKFDVVEVHNPDEWYMVVQATDENGERWELMDTLVWMPDSPDSVWEALHEIEQDPPTEPGEYWQEW